MKIVYYFIIVTVIIALLSLISYGCYLTYNESKLIESQKDSIKTQIQILYEPVIIFMKPKIEHNSKGYYYSVEMTDVNRKVIIPDFYMTRTSSVDSLLLGIDEKFDEKYNEVMQGYHISDFIPTLPGKMRPLFQK